MTDTGKMGEQASIPPKLRRTRDFSRPPEQSTSQLPQSGDKATGSGRLSDPPEGSPEEKKTIRELGLHFKKKEVKGEVWTPEEHQRVYEEKLEARRIQFLSHLEEQISDAVDNKDTENYAMNVRIYEKNHR